MSRLEVLGVGLAVGLVAGLLIGSSMARGATSRPLAEPVPSWTPVELPSEAPRAGASLPAASAVPSWAGLDSPAPSVAVVTRQPDSPTATPTPRPTRTRAPVAGNTATGNASWYCGNGSPCTSGYPAGGLFAAAGPALRVGAWRGRYVTVNGLRVRLVDWCGCPDGRIVDLYASVVRALGLPLSQGIYGVTVRW